MTDERRRILNMMAEGKVDAAEAEALLDALSKSTTSKGLPPRLRETPKNAQPKYLRVLVEGPEDGRSSQVNVRVPIELIRAGMRLGALLPVVAYDPVERALKQHGLNLDIELTPTPRLRPNIASFMG